MVDKAVEKLPNLSPDGPIDRERKGLLSPIGDVVGQVLDKTLKPTLGPITGAIGRPSGEALQRIERTAKNDIGYSEEDRPDHELPGGRSIGGNPQSGQNPLGL